MYNLDAPDGCNFLLHDLRNESKSFFNSQQDRGSVMTRGGFRFSGQIFLPIRSKKMNSQDYQKIFEDHFISQQDLQGEPSYIFQQDRMLIFVFNSIKMWSNMHNINVIH